jgi:beta-fructofuranosidase
LFDGLPILLRPETGTLRLGNVDAPFRLAKDEDLELRIFIDKYLVEVFANDRQALIAAHLDWRGKTAFTAYSFGDPTTIRKIDLWKLRPTNQGFFAARQTRLWEPK